MCLDIVLDLFLLFYSNLLSHLLYLINWMNVFLLLIIIIIYGILSYMIYNTLSKKAFFLASEPKYSIFLSVLIYLTAFCICIFSIPKFFSCWKAPFIDLFLIQVCCVHCCLFAIYLCQKSVYEYI